MHHLIFEGAELAGKSWLMSQVYNYLEPKYNQNKNVLDGCHWFNCDIGIYGTKYGKEVIESYLNIFQTLQDKNLIVEKLHISDIVYHRLLEQKEISYAEQEEVLKKLGFKIILIKFPENKEIISERIKDRLNIYPHYKKILKNIDWYIDQQKEYEKEVQKSILPSLIIETNILPDENLVNKILKWITKI